MRPIAACIAWCVGVAAQYERERAKVNKLIEMPYEMWTTMGSNEQCTRWGPDTPCEGALLGS